MPRSQREICDQICSAYFERRSATARALNERGGDDNVRKHLLPCGFDLLKADERDTRILEWYQDDGAPLQTLLLTARRIAIVWMIEFFAEKEPFFLPKLLEFDLHYLHVLQFSRLLADAVPRKLDPLLSSSCGDDLNVRRKNFVKEIGGVWKAVRRSAVKIPAPPDLLQKLHDTIECLKQEPPERKLSDILPPAGRRAMSYNDPELESEEQQELEKDVERARVGSVAYPYKFSETLVNLRKRERPNSEPKIEDEPLERLVWDIKKIRDFVQGGRYIDAATLILSYRYRASEGTVLKELRKATKKANTSLSSFHEVPIELLTDHRRWDVIDDDLTRFLGSWRSLMSAEGLPHEHGARIFARSRTAELEDVSFEDMEVLFE